ncbi:hypothetical protein B0H39_002819 [Clostridium beijerinckii]|nr:hypothetical protein [Clostridium beijerinckii]
MNKKNLYKEVDLIYEQDDIENDRLAMKVNICKYR